MTKELDALKEKHPRIRPDGHGITVPEYAKSAGVSSNTARKRLENDPDFEGEIMIYGKGSQKSKLIQGSIKLPNLIYPLIKCTGS